MRPRSAFRPIFHDELEGRVLLSHGNGRIISPAVVLGGLTPGGQTLNKTTAPSVVTQINASFDSFVADYTQTRGVYLSTLVPGTASAADPNGVAFKNYTRYRIDLLGQQVTSSLLQSYAGISGNSHGQKGLWTDYTNIVQSRVNGPQMNKMATADPSFFRAGTMGRALIDTTPPSGSTPAASSLDSLAQDQAIEAARVSVINGFIYSKNAQSGHKSKN